MDVPDELSEREKVKLKGTPRHVAHVPELSVTREHEDVV